MSTGLLLDHDQMVAQWVFHNYNKRPMHVDKAVGIVKDGQLVGGALFTNYNGINAHFSYYGRNTVTLGILRSLYLIMLYELNLARCTVIVPRRPSYLLKRMPKIGFRYEGVERRFYGYEDTPRNTGCRFVAFREDLERIVGPQRKKVA